MVGRLLDGANTTPLRTNFRLASFKGSITEVTGRLRTGTVLRGDDEPVEVGLTLGLASVVDGPAGWVDPGGMGEPFGPGERDDTTRREVG
ncbi:hypothetical protein K6U06_14585 [Acidiferrimicrobium sp. IK]|uniref:hypothetical protein n=1 Tax=Acidiferrimicrobium sp. IK TaxID=2871700 RepID=UPI0021CB5977|nr:hypothetical protein [Acidiferrimicrobium sp. IK]MCU4185592.1 hypothetical protein [Acidiferrimicrobium sp. IK]